MTDVTQRYETGSRSKCLFDPNLKISDLFDQRRQLSVGYQARGKVEHMCFVFPIKINLKQWDSDDLRYGTVYSWDAGQTGGSLMH